MSLYIGLMSGTSMDGIDAALVDVSSNQLKLGITKQYSDAVKRQIELALAGPVTLPFICQLNTLIGREFAAAVMELLAQANRCASEIKAIGSHGQTLCHNTQEVIPYTLQLGCGHTISSVTGIPVVADFRTRDVVNGGEGAPFAPLYHQQVFADLESSVAVVNIGGIANITLLTPDEATQGWDMGPGNCLMDAWIYKHQGRGYDAHGDWAKQGEVIPELLTRLLADPFLALPAPKSLGKEYYSLAWLEKHLKAEYQPVDVQATLVAYTAHTIANTVYEMPIKAVYLCGGGTHNTQLHRTLTELLPIMPVQSCAVLGIDPDYLEAMMFAWFAAQTMNNQSVDLRSITGVEKLQILGAIYPI